MKLDDIVITRAIIERFSEKLLDSIECEVAIVGGGPAGLIAAFFLSSAGKKVVLFERKLSIGGGMWGGGMMFNEIVVQDEGKAILDKLGVSTRLFKEGYYSADAIESVSVLISKAAKAGTTIFNLMSVEDVMLTHEHVTGLVINWSAVEMSGLHVDPLTVRSKYVVDATGHAAEIASIIQRKSGLRLDTPTGKVIGEKPMWADMGERTILENTKEFFPGVFCAGMCCNAIYGGPRMGPVFGGMLLSGKKVAELIAQRI